MKRRFIYSLFLFFLMAIHGAPAAYAAPPPIPTLTLDNCVSGSYQAWDYTSKVVDCVETSVKDAVADMMDALSTYMTPVVGAMTVLAVAFFGMRMAGGDQGMYHKGIGMLLRLGLILFFYKNLGGFSDAIFSIEDELLDLVSGGYSPWTQIDGFLGMLVGVGAPPVDIRKGLLGIIGVSLFSSTAGGVLFFAASTALISLLMFIFRVVFTYLMAIVMIGFLIAISPLIIPMAMFAAHTERFFKKWLDILFSAMLVPVLLFAFLHLFAGIFSSLITDIFSVLCGDTCVTTSGPAGSTTKTLDPTKIDFSPFQKVNQPKFAWGLPTDPGISTRLQHITESGEAGRPAIQSYINPNDRRAHDTGSFGLPGVHFGPDDVNIMQKLIYAFVGLFIFASFMKSMIEKIPDIAYNITEAYTYINMQPSNLEQNIGSGLRKLRSAVSGVG